MKICLETSSIIGFLKGEHDCQPIEGLLTLAETSGIEIFVSHFAWEEIYKPLNGLGNSRKERLRRVAKHLPKVARLDELRLDFDVLGHDGSAEMEGVLLKAGRPDTEQFLSYAAFGLEFFVTKDEHYLKKSAQSKLEEWGFSICTAEECLNWIRQRGIC